MAEGFENFDGLGPSQGREKAKESDEKFQERYRKQQAAVKKIRKQEANKKQDDDTLAKIIVDFLHDPSYTKHFLLISRLVAENLPSDLILAIIALIYEPARQHIETKFGDKMLQLESPDTAQDYGKANLRIDDWVNKIFIVGSAEPHQVIETCLDYEQKIKPQLIQFSALVLRDYLEKFQKKETDFQNITNFSISYWRKLLGQLKAQIDHQKFLESSENEDDENLDEGDY
ncbi:MAG: hypothetical protein ACOC1P_03715 [Minisyncoccales bacterium]